jgi:hypothetical protein
MKVSEYVLTWSNWSSFLIPRLCTVYLLHGRPRMSTEEGLITPHVYYFRSHSSECWGYGFVGHEAI